MGKDKLKALVASFGGRVTGSVSGKTDILIVGKDPGFSKVSEARKRSIQLVGLKDLALGLQAAGGMDIVDIKPMKIKNFSSGYRGNGLVTSASEEELAIAQGLKEAKVVTKQRIKGTKKVNNSTTKKRSVKANDFDNVTCDSCGVDCTSHSWFVQESESDFCDACNPGGSAVQQCNGVTVATIKDDPEQKRVTKKRKVY